MRAADAGRLRAPFDRARQLASVRRFDVFLVVYMPDIDGRIAGLRRPGLYTHPANGLKRILNFPQARGWPGAVPAVLMLH
jgi:hypothetical protein